MNIGYILKPHSRQSNNGLWKNNYDLGLLIQHIEIQRKGSQVLLLGSHYGKRPLTDNFRQIVHRISGKRKSSTVTRQSLWRLLIDNFRQENSVYFNIFSEKKFQETCSAHLKMTKKLIFKKLNILRFATLAPP